AAPHQQDARLRAGTRAHPAGFVHGGRDCREAEAGRLQGPDACHRDRLERPIPLPVWNGEYPMTHRPLHVSRRTFLRGTGVALGLPWLEAMMPTKVQAAAGISAKPPVRMAVLYMPNGVHQHMWTPEGVGRNFSLSPTLEPIADLKDNVMVLTNLWNEVVKDGSVHLPRCAGFLTST